MKAATAPAGAEGRSGRVEHGKDQGAQNQAAKCLFWSAKRNRWLCRAGEGNAVRRPTSSSRSTSRVDVVDVTTPVPLLSGLRFHSRNGTFLHMRSLVQCMYVVPHSPSLIYLRHATAFYISRGSKPA